MTGPVCHFKLKEGATPFALRGSRPVAVPLLPLLRTELDLLEAQDIIRKVVEPTEWVHQIVLVPKKDGGIRLCVDFRNPNKSIVRPLFDANTPFQAVRTISHGMKYFTAYRRTISHYLAFLCYRRQPTYNSCWLLHRPFNCLPNSCRYWKSNLSGVGTRIFQKYQTKLSGEKSILTSRKCGTSQTVLWLLMGNMLPCKRHRIPVPNISTINTSTVSY